MLCVLLAVAIPVLENPEALQLNGGARAYFESGYISSSGRLAYTKPVAEQWAFLKVSHEDLGWLMTDGWLCSILNDQTDDVHRRAFYCYEGTVTYGNALRFAEDMSLSAWGGMIWDWLGGYKEDVGTPFGWICEFRLKNPYLTPYLNGLGFIEHSTWVRVRVGLNRQFEVVEDVTLTPFVEATWGDPARYRSNYGGETDGDFLGGSLMFASFGLVAEWAFWDPFYLWGRYRQFILVDPDARNLIEDSDAPTAKKAYPVFGLGVGFRF